MSTKFVTSTQNLPAFAVTAASDQALTIGVRGAAGAAPPPQYVLPDLDAEYRLRPPDEPLLRAIASATGGVFKPAPADLSARAGTQHTSRRALWPALVILALGLWMLDILFRRVRLFEVKV